MIAIGRPMPLARVGANDHDSLPQLIERATTALAAARTSAEVLEARDLAGAAYDMAKREARLAKVRGAHDTLVTAARQMQGHALKIESAAKMRLADEYDAAQDRGEVQKPGGDRTSIVPVENNALPTVTEIGLTRKDIHEARQIRDAEDASPGIVQDTVDRLVTSGEEPTRAALTREIANRTSFTGNNQWFTPDEHIERSRRVLGEIDLDPASHEIAQQRVKAKSFFTEEEDGLTKEWPGRVWLNPPYAQPEIGHFIDKIVEETAAGRCSAAIVLTHNYTDNTWFQKAARAAQCICFTRGRVRFVSPTGELASPTQGQAFFYFGDDAAGFAREFADVGFVMEMFK